MGLTGAAHRGAGILFSMPMTADVRVIIGSPMGTMEIGESVMPP